MNAEQFINELSEKVIKAIENGCNPWRKPWKGGVGIPYNGLTERLYTGTNALSLAFTDYDDPRFYTLNQVAKFGAVEGNGNIVSMSFLATLKDEDGVPKLDKHGKVRKYWGRRYIEVYNHEQIKFKDPSQNQKLKVNKREIGNEKKFVEQWANKCGIVLQEGPQASYNALTHRVTLPKCENFITPEGYISTAAHEFSHWTGKDSVTGRHTKQAKQQMRHKQKYAIEELVAEISSSTLVSELNIWTPEEEENSVSYLRGWIKAFKDDPKILGPACGWANTAYAWLRERFPNVEVKELKIKNDIKPAGEMDLFDMINAL